MKIQVFQQFLCNAQHRRLLQPSPLGFIDFPSPLSTVSSFGPHCALASERLPHPPGCEPTLAAARFSCVAAKKKKRRRRNEWKNIFQCKKVGKELEGEADSTDRSETAQWHNNLNVHSFPAGVIAAACLS